MYQLALKITSCGLMHINVIKYVWGGDKLPLIYDKCQ